MRGRITAMWVIQSIEGLFCILMGLVTVGFDGPDEPGFSAIPTEGIYTSGGVRGPRGTTLEPPARQPRCKASNVLRARLLPRAAR